MGFMSIDWKAGEKKELVYFTAYLKVLPIVLTSFLLLPPR